MSQHGTKDSKALDQAQSKPPNRCLVVMFDGIGIKRQNMTNVSRMFEAIDDSLPEFYRPTDGSEYCSLIQSPASKMIVQCKTCNQTMEPVKHDGDDREANFRASVQCGSCHQVVVEPLQPIQLVKYIAGVGTDYKGVVGWLSDQILGYGLPDKIKEGYTWLCNHHQEGDKIFVFGFSGGAFAARFLVSLVHRCGGVLKKKSISAKVHPMLKEESPVVVKAYDMFQAYVQTTTADGKDKRDPALHKDFYNAWQDFTTTATKDSFRIQSVTVKMLGVWDTVAPAGIPETGYKVLNNMYPFSRFGSKQYQFHDRGLSCIVENAYHALALDEHCKYFRPTLWAKATPQNQEVKQVWFVGSQCNVGGGADLEDDIDPDDHWQYSYVWMQNHALKHGLRFYWTYDSPLTQSSSSKGTLLPTRRVSAHALDDSYARFLHGGYKWFSDWFDRKPSETNGAKLHWSVTDRIEVLVNSKKGGYYPKSLFGRDGKQFTKVERDMMEFQKLDKDTPGLVKKTLWQIETDDAEETSTPLHRLPAPDCGCLDEEVAPVKQTGFWSWLGF